MALHAIGAGGRFLGATIRRHIDFTAPPLIEPPPSDQGLA